MLHLICYVACDENRCETIRSYRCCGTNWLINYMQTRLYIWLTSHIRYFNIKYFQSAVKFSHYFILIENHCNFRNIRTKMMLIQEKQWKLKAKEIIPFTFFWPQWSKVTMNVIWLFQFPITSKFKFDEICPIHKPFWIESQ